MVAESAAVVLYLAEKAGKLIPGDLQGRTRVVQWCFAATSTVEPAFTCIDFMEMFDKEKAAPKFHDEVRKLAGRWLGDLERRLDGREWIACADFTVADVLRTVRKTDLMKPFPKIEPTTRAASPAQPGAGRSACPPSGSARSPRPSHNAWVRRRPRGQRRVKIRRARNGQLGRHPTAVPAGPRRPAAAEIQSACRASTRNSRAPRCHADRVSA